MAGPTRQVGRPAHRAEAADSLARGGEVNGRRAVVGRGRQRPIPVEPDRRGRRQLGEAAAGHRRNPHGGVDDRRQLRSRPAGLDGAVCGPRRRHVQDPAEDARHRRHCADTGQDARLNHAPGPPRAYAGSQVHALQSGTPGTAACITSGAAQTCNRWRRARTTHLGGRSAGVGDPWTRSAVDGTVRTSFGSPGDRESP